MAGFSLRDRWIYSIYTWFSRSRVVPFDLSGMRNRPVRLLICLPSNPEEARKAVEIIPELAACLEAESVTVAGEPRSVVYCDLKDERVSVEPLDSGARWLFGLPSFRIIDRLSEERFSMAVDLNPWAELLPAVLCLSTGAPIRLCLDDPQRRQVFNLRIQLADDPGDSETGADPPSAPAHAEPSTMTGADPPAVPALTEPSTTRNDASSGDSPYVRLLRVVQAAVRPRVPS